MSTSTRSPVWQGSFSQTGDSRVSRGRPDWTDAVFFLLLALGAGFALTRYSQAMDYYEKLILCGTVPVLAWLGWLWRPLRRLMLACALATGLALLLWGAPMRCSGSSICSRRNRPSCG